MRGLGQTGDAPSCSQRSLPKSPGMRIARGVRFRGAFAAAVAVAVVVPTTGFALPGTGPAPYPEAASPSGLPGGAAPTGSIETAPSYVPQNSCDPAEKKGIRAFKQLVMAAYPAGRDWGSSRDCAADGVSEHLEGRAWDWNVDVSDPTAFNQAGELLTWLTADSGTNANRLGIMYIVYNHKIWGAYRASEGWRKLSGGNPHTDHVHFSFTWNGARKKTSFWTGSATSQDFGPCRIYVGQPAPIRTSKNSGGCPSAMALPSTWAAAKLLWRGSSGSLVNTAQGKLGVARSGFFDANTASATADFQRGRGLPVTGAVDAQTWFALGMGSISTKAKRTLKKGMQGKDVKRLQRALGFKKKLRDGRYRKPTVRAVKAWKRSRGMTVNGRASVGFQQTLGI